MYPDQIISKNFFQFLFKNKNYYELFFMPGLKIALNKNNKIFLKKKNISGIETKELSKFINNNLHVKMKLMTINNEYYNNAPAWLIYKNPNELIVKSFHLTPIMFKNKLIKYYNPNNKIGIDDYLTKNFLSNKIKFIENSNNVAWCTYENENLNNFSSFKNTKSYIESFRWIESCTSKYQQYLFKKYVFHLFANKKYTDKLKKIKISFILFNLLFSLYKFSKYLKLFKK